VSFGVAIFEFLGAPIHAFPSFFVLVIVLEGARSMTSTSTIRLGGVSAIRRKSQSEDLIARLVDEAQNDCGRLAQTLEPLQPKTDKGLFAPGI